MTASELNTEVITVLNTSQAYWDPCCGPNGNGLTSAELLTQLDSSFPDSNWTETQLSDVLTTGIRRGRYKQLPEDTYYMNQNMIRVNGANSIYSSASNKICMARACSKPYSVML